MIDRVLAAKGKDTYQSTYQPTDALTGEVLLNSDAENLAVIFPQWHDDGHLTGRLARRLAADGWAVLRYSFHDQILEPHIERVPQSYSIIKNAVKEDLSRLRRQYERLHLLGISLGTLAMSLVASEYPDFDSATFALPSSSLPHSMWVSARTQGVRQMLEQQGHSHEDVIEAWRELIPADHAFAFEGRPVQTFLSSKDRIILPRFQYQMNEALACAGANISSNVSRFGHAASIIKFCFSGRIE